MNLSYIVDIIHKNHPNTPHRRLYITSTKDKFTIFDNYDLQYSCGLIYDSGKWQVHSNSLLARAPITKETAIKIATNFFGEGAILAEEIVSDHINELSQQQNNLDQYDA